MKRVLQQLGVYKKDALLCVGLTTLEVIMEILLPFITARLIAEGLEASNLSAVYRYGAVLVVMALFSLIFGATAGPAWPPTCGRPFTPTFRPFPFPTSTSSACPAWSPA